jgi:hypothetical protein
MVRCAIRVVPRSVAGRMRVDTELGQVRYKTPSLGRAGCVGHWMPERQTRALSSRIQHRNKLTGPQQDQACLIKTHCKEERAQKQFSVCRLLSTLINKTRMLQLGGSVGGVSGVVLYCINGEFVGWLKGSKLLGS